MTKKQNMVIMVMIVSQYLYSRTFKWPFVYEVRGVGSNMDPMNELVGI